MDERTVEGQRKEFDAIPAERTFCTVKLYLDDDNDITGMVQYDGHVLKDLGVPEALGMECRNASLLAQRYCQRAVNEAGALASIKGFMRELFGEGEGDDGGQAPVDESVAGVSYGGEGGIELDSKDSNGSDSRAATASTSGE